MKRKMYAIFTFLLTAMLSVCMLVACQKKGETKAVVLESVTKMMIVMKVVEAEEGATALSALTKLKADGEITFEAQESTYGAYITSINGKAEESSGNSGYSWMLYTSDEVNSSTEYGSLEYNGVTYGQAAVGASSLIVKEGAYYIWAYQSWSF